MERLKNSIGIWAFGPNATRFVPGGYHTDAVREDMIERTKRAVDGLGELVDSYEYHYPTEIDESNLAKVQQALNGKEIYCLALGLFSNPRYALGSFVNPDPNIRKEVVDICKRGIDMAASLGAHFIIWPGAEGYNYPFQVNYQTQWDYFIDGIAAATEHAASKGVTIFLEHKNSEPAMKILMRDMGMTMYTIHKVKERGVDAGKLLVNMDWQHLIMNGENLPEYAALLAKEGLLGHQHANSGWGIFDDDNMVGASFFMQSLAIARILQDVGYGKKGERMGFDLFPYTEDQVAAVRRSVLQWEFLWDLASRLDRNWLQEAESRKDAVAAYDLVYELLGLDQKFIDKVYASRKQ